MNESRTARKEELHLQYKQLMTQAQEEVFEFLNLLPGVANQGITIKNNSPYNLRHDLSWKAKLNPSTNYRYETRFTIFPNLENTFGAEIDLQLDSEGLHMNYGTCGNQNLSNDTSFIQKNLLIGIITLNQSRITEYLLHQETLLQVDAIIEEVEKINEQEWKEEAEAKRKAKEEAEAKKLAEKKAKAAARRKARREAQKAANQ